MILWNCCTQYASKFGKLSSGHRTGKCQFSFQYQRKAMSKNAQTTTQFHSSHTLVNQCLKFAKSGFSNMWAVNFQMFKLDLEKAEEPEIKLPTSAGSSKKNNRIPEKHLLLLFWLYQNLCMDHNKPENSSRDGNTRPPDLPLQKSVCKSEATVRTGHGTTDWFQIGKGVH